MHKRLITQAIRTFSSRGPYDRAPSTQSTQQQMDFKKSKLDETMREKLQNAPEFDEKDDVSFQDNYLILKFIGMGVLTAYLAYKGHNYMSLKLEKR